MKANLLLLSVAFLMTDRCGFAQPIPRTNEISGTDAVKIASHLSDGMLEANAKKFLGQNGLTSFGPWFPIGPYGWSVWYPLKDGTALVVGSSAPPSRSNIWTNGIRRLGGKDVTLPLAVNNVWTNGHLRLVYLQTNAMKSIGNPSVPVFGVIPANTSNNVWTTLDILIQQNSTSISMTHTNEP